MPSYISGPQSYGSNHQSPHHPPQPPQHYPPQQPHSHHDSWGGSDQTGPGVGYGHPGAHGSMQTHQQQQQPAPVSMGYAGSDAWSMPPANSASFDESASFEQPSHAQKLNQGASQASAQQHRQDSAAPHVHGAQSTGLPAPSLQQSTAQQPQAPSDWDSLFSRNTSSQQGDPGAHHQPSSNASPPAQLGQNPFSSASPTGGQNGLAPSQQPSQKQPAAADPFDELFSFRG